VLFSKVRSAKRLAGYAVLLERIWGGLLMSAEAARLSRRCSVTARSTSVTSLQRHPRTLMSRVPCSGCLQGINTRHAPLMSALSTRWCCVRSVEQKLVATVCHPTADIDDITSP